MLQALGAILAVAVLWSILWLTPRLEGTGSGPVFSVALLQEYLAASPRTWLGRVVYVRAVAVGCWVLGGPGTATCRVWRPALIDHVGQTDTLALRWSAPSPLRLIMHRLPLLGDLASVQGTQWDMPAIYHIRLAAVPCSVPSNRSCYAAVLLDAVPSSG
jgi:hypothetical protein